MVFVAFVIPLGAYCLILAWINRSRNPVLVSGTWDFIGVLLASAGFLFIGGPAILAQLYEEWRVPSLLGQTPFLPGLARHWESWLALWVLYFVVVVVGAAWVLRRRRWQTSIYNITSEVFGEVFARSLDRLGLEWTRSGNCFLIRARELSVVEEKAALRGTMHAPVAADRLTGQLESRVSFQAGELRVHLDPSPVFRHVSLDWSSGEPLLRREVEEELARTLVGVRMGPNPASLWFTIAALGFFFAAFAILLGMLIYRLMH